MKIFQMIFLVLLMAIFMPLFANSACNVSICKEKGGSAMTFYTGATLTLNSGAIFTNAGTTVLTGALTGTSIALSSTYTGLGNFYSGAAGFVSTNTAADGNWVMAADVDVIADLTAGTIASDGGISGTTMNLTGAYTGLGNFYSGAAGFVSTNTAADGNWVMAADVDVIADLTAGTIVSDAGIEGVTLTNVIQIETPNTSYSAVEVGTEIVPTASFFVINGTGTLTLTSTPTISTMTAVNGQIIEILGGANAVTFQDNGTASGTLLELGDTGRQIGANDILRLRYYDGSWIESYWADN